MNDEVIAFLDNVEPLDGGKKNMIKIAYYHGGHRYLGNVYPSCFDDNAMLKVVVFAGDPNRGDSMVKPMEGRWDGISIWAQVSSSHLEYRV